MASQSRTDELFEMLRARGLRTRVARALSDAAAAGRGGAATSQKAAQGIIDDLRKLADEIEDRVTGGNRSKRSEAAKKAARTRTRKANQRSASAKKAAATRKRSSSSSSSSKPAATAKRAASTAKRAASSTTKRASSTTKRASSTTKRGASGGTRRRTTKKT
jgi:hypothetical protein